MLKDCDLTYRNKNGKSVHGTAALLHRMFGKQPSFRDSYDKESVFAEYKRLIQKCGYADFDN